MAENNELTSLQLYNLFKEKYPEVSASISTIKRARRELGWVAKRTEYCAMHDCGEKQGEESSGVKSRLEQEI